MRRTVAVLAVAALSLAACSGGKNRTFERYYDPAGMFSTYLPAGNDVTVAMPQPPAAGPGLLAGVVSRPPAPSPSPATGASLLGQGGLGQAAPSDQTVYQVFVVTTNTFSSVGDMALFFLTGDPQVDLKSEQRTWIGVMKARLVVADIKGSGGQATASVAAAFSLGVGGRGYVIAAVFPPGTWDKESSDFFKILRSFQPEVPPGVKEFPLAGG